MAEDPKEIEGWRGYDEGAYTKGDWAIFEHDIDNKVVLESVYGTIGIPPAVVAIVMRKLGWTVLPPAPDTVVAPLTKEEATAVLELMGEATLGGTPAWHEGALGSAGNKINAALQGRK